MNLPLSIETIKTAAHLVRRDAARWVEPQQFRPYETVSPLLVGRLLLRHPSLRATTWMRIGGAAGSLGIRGMRSWTQRRILRLYGLEVATMSARSHIGGGLYIAHPVGCVLAAESIGEEVTVISQVTFGTRDDGRWPIVEDRTFFGAGARVLGGVTIGRGARVGANAVVLDDVAPNSTVVGVPARSAGPL